MISSGTDEVRAKREPSLCNESVNGHFWSNLCLNCIFKRTWFVKTFIWSVIDRSRVRFPVKAALIFFLSFFTHFCLFFDLVPLLFHSNFQSWQMLSLPTLDPYVFFTWKFEAYTFIQYCRYIHINEHYRRSPPPRWCVDDKSIWQSQSSIG